MAPSTSAAETGTPVQRSPDDEGAARFERTALAREISFLTARARARGNAAANRALADLDLKVRPYAVLAMACSDTQPSQREVGTFLDLDPSQVVALVDSLEQRGAIRREPDPRDRRSKVLVATQAGQELYARAAERARDAEEHTLQALTAEERNQLRGMLAKVVL